MRLASGWPAGRRLCRHITTAVLTFGRVNPSQNGGRGPSNKLQCHAPDASHAADGRGRGRNALHPSALPPRARLFNDCCRWWRTLAGNSPAGTPTTAGQTQGHLRCRWRDRSPAWPGRWRRCPASGWHCRHRWQMDCCPPRPVDPGHRLEHHPGLNHRQNAPRLVRSAGSQPLSRGQQLWRSGWLRLSGRGQHRRRGGRGR